PRPVGPGWTSARAPLGAWAAVTARAPLRDAPDEGVRQSLAEALGTIGSAPEAPPGRPARAGTPRRHWWLWKALRRPAPPPAPADDPHDLLVGGLRSALADPPAAVRAPAAPPPGPGGPPRRPPRRDPVA